MKQCNPCHSQPPEHRAHLRAEGTPPQAGRRMARASRRGAALMLAIFATMVVGTTTLAYVASRDTSVAIARNAQVAADARTIAAAAMDLAKNILRSSDSSWRTNQSNGVLLSNYSIDGGTVSVSLVDIIKRTANPSGNIFPDATTTQVEVTVTSHRGTSTWTSVAHMSIPTVVNGQYAIFANRVLLVDGSNNFIGRWENAPMTSQNLRVNMGTMATTSVLNNGSPELGSGVFLQGGSHFESTVAGSNPAVPDSTKSTWVYYPNSASAAVVGGASASLVAAKQMTASQSIAMMTAPAAPSVSGTYTNYTNNVVLNGVTQSFNSFRVRAVFLPQLFTRNFEVRANSTVTLNTGTYEVWGSWILRDSRIIINGDVKFVVNPNLALTGLDWQNSSVEINSNSTLEIYDGYSMSVRNCWIGPRVQCLSEPDVSLRDGDPHKKAWFNAFQANQCFATAPSSPQYMEPWRVRIYPMPQFLSSGFNWDVTDSSIVASFFLPTNPIRLYGRTKIYGRIAANYVLCYDTASVYYDHGLDLVTGLTEGTTPTRGGDSNSVFPVRVVSFGFDAENAR